MAEEKDRAAQSVATVPWLRLNARVHADGPFERQKKASKSALLPCQPRSFARSQRDLHCQTSPHSPSNPPRCPQPSLEYVIAPHSPGEQAHRGSARKCGACRFTRNRADRCPIKAHTNITCRCHKPTCGRSTSACKVCNVSGYKPDELEERLSAGRLPGGRAHCTTTRTCECAWIRASSTSDRRFAPRKRPPGGTSGSWRP